LELLGAPNKLVAFLAQLSQRREEIVEWAVKKGKLRKGVRSPRQGPYCLRVKKKRV